MNESAWKITGHHAIRIAERDSVTLYKAADPVEGYRVGISPEEARAVASEDPSLIYCIVDPAGWTGDADGFHVCDYFRGSLNGHARSGATYLGPDDSGNEPRWQDAKGGAH